MNQSKNKIESGTRKRNESQSQTEIQIESCNLKALNKMGLSEKNLTGSALSEKSSIETDLNGSYWNESDSTAREWSEKTQKEKGTLKALSNEGLNLKLKSLIQEERELLSEILLHIAEVDRRKLYLKMAYSSLFEYLTKQMGYSAGSAQRRIDAARLMKDVPELTDKLESGEVSLAQVSFVQKSIRQSSSQITKEIKQALIQDISGLSLEDSQKTVAQALDIEIKAGPQVRVQKDDSVRFEVTLSQEQWRKLQQMRELLSTSLPRGSWDQVLEYVADKVIQRKSAPCGKAASKSKERKQPKVIAHPQDKEMQEKVIVPTQAKEKQEEVIAQAPTREIQDRAIVPENNAKPEEAIAQAQSEAESEISTPRPSPNVTVSKKKFILQKDQCCQFQDPVTKRKCGSRWNLQVDHIQPRWAGGGNELENLRVLCANHNRFVYREQAGIR